MVDVLEEGEMKKYKIGDRFENKEDKTQYILAQCTYERVALIALTDGNRWAEAVEVNNPRNISSEEFNKITGSIAIKEFKAIDLATTTLSVEKSRTMDK